MFNTILPPSFFLCHSVSFTLHLSFCFLFHEIWSGIECLWVQASHTDRRAWIFFSLVIVSVSDYSTITLSLCFSFCLSGWEISIVRQMLYVFLYCSLDTVNSTLCLFHVYNSAACRGAPANSLPTVNCTWPMHLHTHVHARTRTHTCTLPSMNFIWFTWPTA